MGCGKVKPKTLLLFLSLIFSAAGVALVYVGSNVISSYENFEDFRVDKYTVIPAVVIIHVGVLMFITGLIGCCASEKMITVGLVFFLLFSLQLFVVEVMSVVCGIINRSRVNGDLDKSMNEVFEKYNGENSETRAVDYLQTQLECCGVKNYTDWSSRPWFGSHNNSVPHSCCKANTTCTGQFNHPELLNTNGCKDKLEQLLQNVLAYAMLVILGFALIKLCGMLSICAIICRSSRNDYQPLYA